MADSDDQYDVKSSSRSGYDYEDRISRHKPREEDQYKARDKERRRNHDHRVDKARSTRDDRRRGRHDDEYHTHDHERNRDRDKRHTGRGHSPSRERYRKRSRSPSHSKSKRESGFDMAPPVASMFASAPAPCATQVMSGGIQNIFPVVIGQATRHARRVYVGGLPPTANEQTIATFFSQVMAVIGGNSAGPGDAVINVYINHEKKFAFLEMRSVEEASNAMALDGITFEACIGVPVRVRRPADYNSALAATLGPSQPSPHLNLAAIGLMPGAIAAEADGPDRIFVGGIPYSFTEVQIRQLLESFGPLKGFDLVKDRDTGNSKGYGFCSYQDPGVTDIACQSLNGLKMGDKTLTVRRATVSNVQAKSEQEIILAQARQHIAMQSGGTNFLQASLGIPELPTKILCLTEVVTSDTLKDDNEYEEIVEDMREECGKYGVLMSVIIPRPAMSGEHTPGVGKVFLEYADAAGCSNAKNNLGGRKFGGSTVSASYYPEAKFYGADYSS
ncbi:hypothetical protein V2J09_009919 [Rumex salicifolius]